MSRAEWIAVAALVASLASLLMVIAVPVLVFRKGIVNTFGALSQAVEENMERSAETRQRVAERMDSIRAADRREPLRSFQLPIAATSPTTPPPSPPSPRKI